MNRHCRKTSSPVRAKRTRHKFLFVFFFFFFENNVTVLTVTDVIASTIGFYFHQFLVLFVQVSVFSAKYGRQTLDVRWESDNKVQ